MAINAAAAETARDLVELLETHFDEPGRGIRVEDLVSGAAAVTGQACIGAAGDFDPDEHDFAPGAPVMSDRVNQILVGDATDWEHAPLDSVFATLRGMALTGGYSPSDFPAMAAPIRRYAQQIGGDPDAAEARFGRVSLSVPVEHQPRRQPLQDAWNLRGPVRDLFARRGLPVVDQPLACAIALGVILTHVKDAISRPIAVRIALETVNGMAKMAPMTPRHWAEATRQR